MTKESIFNNPFFENETYGITYDLEEWKEKNIILLKIENEIVKEFQEENIYNEDFHFVYDIEENELSQLTPFIKGYMLNTISLLSGVNLLAKTKEFDTFEQTKNCIMKNFYSGVDTFLYTIVNINKKYRITYATTKLINDGNQDIE
jgi:uncharacterized Rmd1/YagE family protein